MAPLFWSFRVMVGLGMFFIVLTATFFVLSARHKLDAYPWLLKVAVMAIPLPWIAAECGYDAAEVTRYLSSTEDEDIVRERERQIRASGVKVVPTFILAGSKVIAGAEDPALFAAEILECLR